MERATATVVARLALPLALLMCCKSSRSVPSQIAQTKKQGLLPFLQLSKFDVFWARETGEL
jgi:hypothetical protein